MGAVNIWNAMEVVEEARDSCGPAIASSPLAVDTSFSPPEMSPRVMWVVARFHMSVVRREFVSLGFGFGGIEDLKPQIVCCFYYKWVK